jgi:hypothetical protein
MIGSRQPNASGLSGRSEDVGDAGADGRTVGLGTPTTDCVGAGEERDTAAALVEEQAATRMQAITPIRSFTLFLTMGLGAGYSS